MVKREFLTPTTGISSRGLYFSIYSFRRGLLWLNCGLVVSSWLVTVFSVFRQFTASAYPFGIYMFFLLKTKFVMRCSHECTMFSFNIIVTFGLYSFKRFQMSCSTIQILQQICLNDLQRHMETYRNCMFLPSLTKYAHLNLTDEILYCFSSR